MKKNKLNTVINCLLVCALYFTSCKSPTPSALTEADKQYIRDSNKSAQDGWNQGDREPYIGRYSTDANVMAPHMETIVGTDAIRTYVKSYPELKLYFNDLEIIGSSDYAYVRGVYKTTDPADAFLDKGKFVSFWKKLPDGKWSLTHDIYNSDQPVPVAQRNTDQKK